MDINYDRYQAMSIDDVEKIHEYTVDVLTNTGIWVEDNEARDIFKKKWLQNREREGFSK